MDYNIISTVLGLIVGGAVSSMYWVFKYNDLRFELDLVRDDYKVVQAKAAKAATTAKKPARRKAI